MPLESDKVVALRRLLAAGASFFHRLKYHVSSLSQDVTSTSPTKTIVTAIMVN